MACVLMMGATPSRADSVQLPYLCAVDKAGRLTLTPSGSETYRIVGPRDSRAFTTCAPRNPDLCRTWQLHKFDLMCGTARVSWLGVVGAVMERSAARVEIENSRLYVRLGPAFRPRPAADGRSLLPAVRIGFPTGFAPILSTGATIVSAAPPPTVIDAVAARAPEKSQARPDGAAPAIAVSAPPSTPARPAETSSWQTTILPALSASPALSRRLAVLAAGVVTLWLVLAVWRRRRAQQEAAAQAAGHEAAAAHCADLISRAVNRHRSLRDAINEIPDVRLRVALEDDVARIKARLLSTDLSEHVAGGRFDQAQETVRAALTDLDRIGEIIAKLVARLAANWTASGSDSGRVRVLDAVPATEAEAYELLGINPDASRTVVKKVVDGLRQSWHPDHAKDDSDRLRREDRMKQINIAWDLIQGKQRAA